ncbi:hypothetical protein [Mycobacterium sp.]|uniref:hypothetical protein n=1 Tax=Mycobacterium sp. TaxID=1785 RepID=UPI0025D3D3C6|nr:hypothetical protein [Mycobacterium sp.]MBW0014080.1 hypothetical protein [Mycobacterium sp.]
MNKKKLKELREYYDNTDTSAEIVDAELDDEIVQSPMVGITVRLPAEVLQRVRERAAQENIKTTALIRRWIEHHVEPRSLFGGPIPTSPSVTAASVTSVYQTILELHTNASLPAQTREVVESFKEFEPLLLRDRVST